MFEQQNNRVSSQHPNVQTSKPIIQRHSLIAILVMLALPVLISQCGLDIEDPTPPSAPRWVQKSFLEVWPERGIDAHESGGIYMEWLPNPEDNVVAYYIYRAEYYTLGDSLGDFEQLSRFDMESINALEFIDSDAKLQQKYFYTIRASDNSKNMSVFSDTITYMSLIQVPLGLMSPNGTHDILPNTRELRWSYNYLFETENYCLTILSQNDELILRSSFFPTNYSGWTESWHIPDEIYFESGNIYKWRIDGIGSYDDNIETAGSESEWASFMYRKD